MTSLFSEKTMKSFKTKTKAGSTWLTKVENWLTNISGSLKLWIVIPLKGFKGVMKCVNASLVSSISILLKQLLFLEVM